MGGGGGGRSDTYWNIFETLPKKKDKREKHDRFSKQFSES